MHITQRLRLPVSANWRCEKRGGWGLTLPRKEFAIQYCKDWMFEKRDDIDVNGKLKSCVLVLIGLVEESEEKNEVSKPILWYLSEAKADIKNNLVSALSEDDVDTFLKLSNVYVEMMGIIARVEVPDDIPSFTDICVDPDELETEDVGSNVDDVTVTASLSDDGSPSGVNVREVKVNPDQDSEELQEELQEISESDSPDPDKVDDPTLIKGARGLKMTVRDGVDVGSLRNSLREPYTLAIKLRGEDLYIYRSDLINELDKVYLAAGVTRSKKKAENVVVAMREKDLIEIYVEEEVE